MTAVMSAAMTPALTWAELPNLMPLILLTGTVLLLMMQAACKRHHGVAASFAILGILASLAWLPMDRASMPAMLTPLLYLDAFVLYCWGLLLLIALLAIGMAWHDWRGQAQAMEELYILLLTATLGACLLVASRHFAALFIGLELMTVSLIGMLGYPVGHANPRTNSGTSAALGPLEAALKYLVLSAVSSAILLFGMALLYAATGSLDFAGLAMDLLQPNILHSGYTLLGLSLLVVGLGFKLSLVPFHLWTPDVYQGAPTPVTGFIASLSKAAVLAVLMRYVLMADVHSQPMLLAVIVSIAVASMLIGNLLALMQDNVKRLLAYSSIAHMGYLLLAPLLAGPYGLEAVGLYLTAYVLMTLGAFAAIGYIGQENVDAREPAELEDLRGLLWRRPFVGVCLSLMFLSLAGIPLTVGFIGKFYLIGAAVQAGLWGPLLALVVGSVIGLFYYLRVIVVMAQSGQESTSASVAGGSSLAGAIVLMGCSLAVLVLGVWPGGLLDLLRTMSQLVG